MNVVVALIAVTTMQVATTLKGVTLALVTLDTKAMDFFVQVLFSNHIRCTVRYISHLYTHIQTLMSASATMEVATTTVITQMEVTHVPAMLATNLTLMDTHVKVCCDQKVLIYR